LMHRYLEGTRYRFVGVRDPEQALTQAQALSPHLILLDVMLPGVDGWEVLGRLRENPVFRSIPVIVSTILPQEQLALTLGAAAFLRKPASRETLLRTLDRLLRGVESG
jgi:CheY-like chemotaxis protein